MNSPIVPMRLVTPDVPDEMGLKGISGLACGVSSFLDLEFFCFTPENSKRGHSIAEPCANVPPNDDGTFQLEMAVVLPDLLPAMDGLNEYPVEVGRDGLTARTLGISNLMSRMRYQIDADHYQALVHRSLIKRIREGGIPFVPKDAPEEPIRSLVTFQTRIAGTTAAIALDNHLSDAFDTFLLYLNPLLRFLSLVDETPGRTYSTAYTRSTFDSFYFALYGASKDFDKIGHGRAMPHAGRAVLNPPRLPNELSTLVRSYLKGTADPTDTSVLIHAAKRYVEAGTIKTNTSSLCFCKVPQDCDSRMRRSR